MSHMQDHRYVLYLPRQGQWVKRDMSGLTRDLAEAHWVQTLKQAEELVGELPYVIQHYVGTYILVRT
jgi:hypothetical protein